MSKERRKREKLRRQRRLLESCGHPVYFGYAIYKLEEQGVVPDAKENNEAVQESIPEKAESVKRWARSRFTGGRAVPIRKRDNLPRD